MNSPKRQAEDSAVLACPHCGNPIPVDLRRDFSNLRRVFLCAGCACRSYFPIRARLAGVAAMLAVLIPVFGAARILGFSENGGWVETLVLIAILLAALPFGIAATRAACRRYADRLVK